MNQKKKKKFKTLKKSGLISPLNIHFKKYFIFFVKKCKPIIRNKKKKKKIMKQQHI